LSLFEAIEGLSRKLMMSGMSMRFFDPLQRRNEWSLETDSPREVFGYEVLDVLGHGAGSVIYLAIEPGTQQICALKHVVVREEKDARLVEQLETEHEVGRQVTHAGLRRTLGLTVRNRWIKRGTQPQAALAMELVDGSPLDREMPGTVGEIVDVFIRAAEALHSLHGMGYVHGDFKPGNVLRGADGAVKVIDLGQVCKIGRAKTRIQGTPDFMAPEQVRCEPLFPWTDVYGFGASLYWCLTGQKVPTLFTAGRGDNSFLVDAQIRSVRELNGAVPESLSNLVMECLRTREEKRPADMREVARRLEVVRFSLGWGGVRLAV
jgi:serine/threonine protein kinase